MIKSFFRWGYRKYCNDEEWELYKNHLGHLLSEIRSAHIRDIVTRVNAVTLRERLLASQSNHESIVKIIVDSFGQNNYYDKPDVANK